LSSIGRNKKTKENREAIEADVALLVRQVITNSDKEFIPYFIGISKEKHRLTHEKTTQKKRRHRSGAEINI
jgi:hypothetical protein